MNAMSPFPLFAGEGFLRKSHGLYEWLVDFVHAEQRAASPEAVLHYIEIAAEFARHHHPGRFVDARLENLALAIGATLDKSPVAVGQQPPRPFRGPRVKRRILHVLTTAYPIGGPTRTVAHWIRKDGDSQHALALIRQDVTPPAMILDAVAQQGGETHVCATRAPLVDKARWLRALARTADLVVLHTDPDDVVPIVALATIDCPFVTLVNQADDRFWLGSSIADSIISLRAPGQALAVERRSARHHSLLPLPLGRPEPRLSRAEARRALGIAEDRPVLLSISSNRKNMPTASRNFYRAAMTVLDRCPDAHLYVVGVTPAGDKAHQEAAAHARLRFVGRIPDPSVHQAAADVYLEGFPFPSPTALLESVLAGAPPVLQHSPPTPLLTVSDTALDGVIDSPADETEYVDRAVALLGDPVGRARVGTELAERIWSNHAGDAWFERLHEMYAYAAAHHHAPHRLPLMPVERKDADRAISEWHETQYRHSPNPDGALSEAVRRRLVDGAYWVRETGDHAGAWKLLRLASGAIGWDREILLTAAKLIPHRLTTAARGGRGSAP